MKNFIDSIKRKCIIKNCLNHNIQGKGFYIFDIFEEETNDKFWICSPCFHHLISGKKSNSQLERNIEERINKK
jgi:hypothetical protein